MTLSIIIVSWNVKPLLERCLSSIFLYGKNLDYEILVVDNNSIDGSKEYLTDLAKKKQELKIVLNNKNLGFAKANNQAIKISKGKFVLFLNPDTEIRGGTLQKMNDFMKKNPNCGIAGCQLIGVDEKIQPSVRSFPFLISQILILLKLPYFLPNLPALKKYFLYSFDYLKEQEVDQLMGAFLMTRREMLEEIGLFDEKFFIWFEEIDLCFRAKEANWQVIYTPRTKILHHGGQSFKQVLSFPKQKIFNQSVIYYFKKHHPPYQSLILKILNPISLFLAYLVDRVGSKS